MSFLTSLIRPIAYVSLPIVLLRTAMAASSVVRYYVRVGMYVGVLMAVATCSSALAAGMSILGYRSNVNYVVARTFYLLSSRIFSFEVEVEGEEHLETRPTILMSNHQTMVDVLILGRMMPQRTCVIAKKSLQLTPLGPFMTMAGAVFVDRGNNAAAIRSLAAAGESIKARDISLWMYPEGTRHSSEGCDILPLKKGGFHLAIQAGIPITPVVTENYWRLFHKGVFDSGKVKVRVLPPIPTTGLTAADVPALATRVRDQMLTVLREISVQVPSGEPESKPEEQLRAPSPSPPVDTPMPNKVEDTVAPNLIDDSSKQSSGESLSSSISNVGVPSKYEGSEAGTETEEDEGMILVGRPA